MPIYSPPPQPATSVPPGVTDTGAIGSAAGFYAMSDHTHASKARKARPLSVTTATYSWTYPTAFGAGVIPVCVCIAEDPANSATDSYNVQVVGAPTNTGCVFRIIRSSVVLGILNLNATPGTVNLHCIALEP